MRQRTSVWETHRGEPDWVPRVGSSLGAREAGWAKALPWPDGQVEFGGHDRPAANTLHASYGPRIPAAGRLHRSGGRRADDPPDARLQRPGFGGWHGRLADRWRHLPHRGQRRWLPPLDPDARAAFVDDVATVVAAGPGEYGFGTLLATGGDLDKDGRLEWSTCAPTETIEAIVRTYEGTEPLTAGGDAYWLRASYADLPSCL